jgi:hypothetical protein
MKLKNYDMSSIAMNSLSTFNLSGLNIEKTIALESLQNEHVEEFKELNDEEVMKARYKYFAIKGTSPEDYEERFLKTSNGNVQYGIRHLGGNREIPFINLLSDYELKTRKDVLVIFENIKKEMSIFSPLCLKFWSKAPNDSDFYGSLYMVQNSNDIKKMKPWILESEIIFEKIIDNSYYEWYSEGYKLFHKKNISKKSKVTVNSLSEMSECIDDDLMYFVNTSDGLRLGLIAATKSNFLGHSSIYFNEIFIDEKYRGLGFAKAIQRKFIDKFVNKNDFIWGTIDATNKPSLKTAISNNRLRVRYECFVKVSIT